MKLAVTYENEMVGQHFGRTEKFKIFDIETALGETGINIVAGVEGKVDEVVNEYLAGTLKSNSNAECHDHDYGEGHNCGHGGCEHH